MRLEMGDDRVTVALSRRNLMTLIAKLDGFPKDSARTIYKDEARATLFVVAEEDAEHYAHLSRDGEPAGTMHQETENRLIESGSQSLTPDNAQTKALPEGQE